MPEGRLLLEAMEERTLLSGTISGLVFEDYNDNGTYDTTSTLANASNGTIAEAVDRGIANVVVTAYDNSNTVRGTADTASDGTYSLAATGTGPYRIVFSGLPAGDTEGPDGPNGAGSVQFVPNGNSSGVDLGVSVPNDYSPNNPLIATNEYVYGDPINGAYANSPTIVGFPYSSGTQYGSGNNALPTTDSFTVPAKSVGATFGLQFSQQTGILYASSYTKRFAGYGPNAAGTGTTDGAVYAINTATGSVSALADLNAIFGANTAGVDFRSLASWTGYGTDGGNTGWDSVGKTSLGGMAISPDGSHVYVMNLADRSIYSIPTSGPINASTVLRTSIPFNAPGATGTNGGTQAGDLRPFAVTYYQGQLYVGIVNSAESTQNKADLKAYVYTVDPTTLTFGANPVFQTSLNYTRGVVWTGTTSPAAWNPWSPTFQTESTGNQAIYPQPMLTGIAFDANGDMTLGIRDRDGDQSGFFTDANPAKPTTTYEGMAGGDTLMAFANTPGNVANGWTLESDGRGPTGQGAGPQNTNLGPGGASFYYQQSYQSVHQAVTSGGVYEIPGFPDVITSSFDPGTTTVRTGGLRFLNTATGATDKSYQIYNTGFNAPPQSTFGKAAGIGDVAAFTGVAPIEIGDRVFQDLNDDGIQDPSDPGIAGVTVHLYQGNTLVGTTITDANGDYLFNASDVPGGLLPDTTYQVRFDNAADWATGGPLFGKVTSIPNVSATSGSKATLVNGVPVIAYTTGGPGDDDHTLDAGFVSTGSVSGAVFNDANDDGIEGTGDTGLAGVIVTLTGLNDLGQPVTVTTTTGTNGSFTFAGLRPSGVGGYTITETPPTGYLVGTDTPGSLGGTATPKMPIITGIPVAPAVNGTGYTFANVLPASLSGFVYSDSNDDGIKEVGELGIPGVTVTLTGTDDQGTHVNVSTTTLGDGSYSFAGLRPSGVGGYTITETQPTGYLDGKDAIGSQGGIVGNDVLGAIPLTPNVAGIDNNFGELAPSSLAGRVYFDANDDGIYQYTELGIPNVTVTLTGLDDRGVMVNVMTETLANGTYSFASLRPSGVGGYIITETPPANYLDGKDAIGTQGGTVGNDTFTAIALAAGVNGINNNFGELQPSSLAGFVYVDSSDDGIKQAGEAGIGSVTITLTGTDDRGATVDLTTTTSTVDGSYNFTNLRPSGPGGYTITEGPTAGFLDGKDTIGTPGGVVGNRVFSGIALVSGFNGVNNNFGELVPASITGFVYIDANQDGRKNAAEDGIGNVIVTLTGTDDLGNPVDLTVQTTNTGPLTTSVGAFTFSGLRPSGPGGYTLTDIPPAGYTVGTNRVGTAGGTLSGQDSIAQVGLTSGAAASGYDFGDYGSTISGTAFVDSNADGLDDGEAGLAGVQVQLLNSLGAVVATTTTAADGTYGFPNLQAGNYTVVETPPVGYGTSTPTSDPVTLTTAGLPGVNFGATTSSISGLVYTDVNGTNTYDPGTDFVGAGSTVELTGTNAAGAIVDLFATTNASGSYSFTGLLSSASGYTVRLVPNGETLGTATVGTVQGNPDGAAVAGNSTVTTIVLAGGAAATGYQLPETGTTIQGIVYFDNNDNQALDPGEAGAGNVTITLTPDGGGPPTRVTAANGTYSFAGITPGTYTITETVPAGLTPTTSTTLANVVVTEDGVKNENFGLRGSSLSGTAYNDLNNSGTLDAGEPGIAGVTVTATSPTGPTSETTTTDANGNYSFIDLPAGTYTITETQPAAYTQGIDTPGTTPNGTVAQTPTQDTISQITLDPATNLAGYNFGERGTSITGEVFLDNNDNTTIDPGEAGVGGVTIELLNSAGAIIATTVTAPDGTYSFNNLPAGSYTTHENRPDGYGSSAATTRPFTLTAGTPVVENYGLTTSTISGLAYLDLNDDGAYAAGDPPIAGVTITLIGTNADGQSVIESTTTAADGTYSFAGLLAGTYSIAQSQPAGYRIGKASAGSSGGTVGTNIVVGIGLGASATVGATVNATGYDFGSLGSPISGTVFVDSNDDGVQEPGEAGLGGVPITLELVGPGGAVVATTMSGADGSYTFADVVAGQYTIVETPPSGYGTSTPTSIPVALTTAGLVGEDFGVTTSSLSGITFLDTNFDNMYTPGVDVPGAGLMVTLTGTDVNGKAVDETTTALADGGFDFTGLLAGTYSVSTAAYPGVNQVPAVPGTSGGTVDGTTTGLDTLTGITLAPGAGSIDNLFPGTGVDVSGTVYVDTNRDGMLDGGEAGVPGVTVTLTGLNVNTGMPVTLSTTTDANGDYSFPYAVAEQGTIAITVPANYAADTPTSIVANVPLTGLAGQDFGLTSGSIGGTIFADANDDGLQSPLDTPLANVVLLLTGTDSSGHAVSLSTVTAGDGSYLFSGLNAGTYTVTEIPPAGYLPGIITPGAPLPTFPASTAGTELISGIGVGVGEASTGNNFAELTPASLAGTVYVDDNDNGNKDAGELGILGVTVTLTGVNDLNQPVTLTTTTRASGNYSFTNLRPGTYTITESEPAGYLDGVDNVGTQGGTLGNRSVTGIVLAAGISGGSNDFAELVPGVISGSVFVDGNDNRSLDQGELGISGVTITLTGIDDLGDMVSLTTTSGLDGSYSFAGLRPSNADGYTVTETPPAGYLPGLETATSTQSNSVITGVYVSSGDNSSGIDFPELLPASLSGYVYQDLKDDGVRDPGDPGVSGVTVTLTGFDDEQNPVSLTATTDANGFYSFTGLRPALEDLRSGLITGYTITETFPAGYFRGTDDLGTPGGVVGVDSFSAIPLAEGVAGLNNNFGVIPPASLSGFAYVDANDDGIKQAGEAGLAGVTVTLSGTDELGDPFVLTTTTAADGSYSFNDLVPSNSAGYTITETPPAGYVAGKDAVGSQGGTPGVASFTGVIAGPGTVGVNNNFASIAPSSLSGTVYLDDNKDGVLEAGEPGLAGVTVTLMGTGINGNPVKTYTITGADGTYSFTGLLPGTYTVSDIPDPVYVQGITAAGSSGGSVAGNVVSGITLGSGVAATAYNFGQTGVTVSGTVYTDTNGDGKPEAGEPGVGGVTITLENSSGQVVATTTTAADGSYSFGNLPTEPVTIVETLPAGTTATSPASIGLCLCDTTTAATGNDFGVAAGDSLSGFVFADLNNDGALERGERGLAGATVALTGTNGLGQSVSITTTTGADGSYSFADLLPGTYTVTSSTVTGYADGKDSAGSTGGTTPNGDVIASVTLAQGAASVNNDFGKVGSTLTGTVTEGGNAVPDATVTVTEGGAPVATVTTGANGTYSVPGLAAGPVVVTATIPVVAGSTPILQTTTATLAPGVPTPVNFAVNSPTAGTISGFVYQDLYDSGVKGGFDPGLPGVLVTLGGTDAQGNVVYRQVYTGPDGSFSFGGLPAGNYNLLEGTFGYYLDGKVSAGSTGGNTAVHLITAIPLAAGSSSVNNDFGHLAPSAITGTVYIDANKNGVDDNEFGLANVPVTLRGYDVQGNPVTATTTTSADGTYVFAGLAPGLYQVTADRITQYFNAGANNPGSAGGVSHGDTISAIPLAEGVIDSGYNFGEVIRKGCVLAEPKVFALLEYGPHPGGVPASLLKGVSFQPGSATAFYVPTLVEEAAITAAAESTATVKTASVVATGQAHPSGLVVKKAPKPKQSHKSH